MENKMISLKAVADYLLQNDNYFILTHQYPDGDTLGSAFALCQILQQKGKKAKVLINGNLQPKFSYLSNGVINQEISDPTVISVDVADKQLLGELGIYSNCVELCIDHHSIHKAYANRVHKDATAAATAEIIYNLGCLLNVTFTKTICDCIYTGVATDTGCFKYSNTTLQTHEIAGMMIKYGCDFAQINKSMFDTVSKAHIEIEKLAMETLTYYHSGKCAIMYTNKEMCAKCGATDDDIEGLSTIPRRIEGVMIGITIRQKDKDLYKVSVRTNTGINAADICSRFGGGGHSGAAGCTISGQLENTLKLLSDAAGQALKDKG